jgi:hypothetical protein
MLSESTENKAFEIPERWRTCTISGADIADNELQGLADQVADIQVQRSGSAVILASGSRPVEFDPGDPTEAALALRNFIRKYSKDEGVEIIFT